MWDTAIVATYAFGGYYQITLIAELLSRGYVVIQAEASGGIYWTTNNGGNYDTSLDGVFIPLLLAALHEGKFGEVDESRLYATGISSGGYMTSRMAVSYPGRFRALAIESGSYATCAGPFCSIPAQLPIDHPPTLLLWRIGSVPKASRHPRQLGPSCGTNWGTCRVSMQGAV